MKDIDFLPAWYRSGRRWQIGYRTQYAGLCGMFAAMMMWNFIATHSLSKAAAALARAELQSVNAESVKQEFAKIKGEQALLLEKARIIEKIDSKINVADVLAEISFLVDRKIVLNKIEFIAEKFQSRKEDKPNNSSAVRAAAGNFSGKEMLPVGDVRFKVLINGVASDVSNVAALVCRLEDSPYFCQVLPLFTRNKEVKTAANIRGEKLQVSEFEISCILANYQQDEPYSAMADKVTEKSQKREMAGL
jgi:hypothetical protein